MNKSESISNKINELFNDSYNFKKAKGSSSTEHEYHFQSEGGHKYKVNVSHDTNGKNETTAHVAFATRGHNIKTTGSEGSSSHKVFGTVKKIVKDHLTKHPEVSKIAFSSDSSDNSRKRLYSSLSKNMSHHHVEHDFGDDRYYLMHKKDMK